jgi:hypothetical protein
LKQVLDAVSEEVPSKQYDRVRGFVVRPSLSTVSACAKKSIFAAGKPPVLSLLQFMSKAANHSVKWHGPCWTKSFIPLLLNVQSIWSHKPKLKKDQIYWRVFGLPNRFLHELDNPQMVKLVRNISAFKPQNY